MTEQIKFTQEELNAVAALQRKFQEVTFRFGQLHIGKEIIEMQIMQNAVDFENTKKELDNIRGEEKTLAKSFQDKYGDGQLNLETGIFTPTPVLPVPQG